MASPFDPPQQQTSANATNCILASAIHHLPFLPLVRPSKLNLQTAAQGLQKLHTSLLLHCVRALDNVASNSPLLQAILSVPSHFRNFCQVHCNNARSFNSLSNHSFAAILPGDSVAGLVVANGISNFLNIYNTLLVIRLVLTWFPNSPPAIVSPLSTICDPYLNIFRGLIPPLGGLDLSPILAFLVLNAFTSTAAALPAELPPQEALSSSNPKSLNLTTMQKKWLRRVHNARSKNSSDAR